MCYEETKMNTLTGHCEECGKDWKYTEESIAWTCKNCIAEMEKAKKDIDK